MSFVDAAAAPSRKTGQIKLHSPADFAGMRKAGVLTAEALDLLVEQVRPGVTTEALDELIFDFAMAHKAYPAPLGYRGYRKSICTSINHVVCHGNRKSPAPSTTLAASPGIRAPRPLRAGDTLNIDVTLIVDGWHGDSSRM